MILLSSFTVLPFALSVMAFSLSLVCVLFYYYMYKRLFDIKYLIRFFLILSISIYFLLENLYFITFINNNTTKAHIYFYMLKEISFLYVILIFFVAMKEITYKIFLSNSTLNSISNILLIASLFIFACAILNTKSFVHIKTIYLNIYQNRVNVYGIGSLFIVKDIIIAFVMVFNITILAYILIFTSARKKYNIITILSIGALLFCFVDDAYGLYFFYHKSNPDIYLSRTSIGLFLFLIGLLSTSILRLLDNLKKIEIEKDIASSRAISESKFLKNASLEIDKTIEIKNALCNVSMLLINISRSSKEYIATLRKKLEYSYEVQKNLIQYEYSKQSSSMYNEYTFTKLSKSFLSFNETINYTEEVIHKITDIMMSLIDKTYAITNNGNVVLRNIKNYSGISKEKTDIMLSYFDKNISFNQLSTQVKRALTTMKSMSERISTLSVNSSIESSKAYEYSKTFSFVSKEIASLVNDTTDVSDKLEYILSSVNDMFKYFSNARNTVLENILNLNNYINSLTLNIESLPEVIMSENENSKNIIDNNKALETLIANIVFLLKDEIENCNSIKEDIKSTILDFSKIDSEFQLYRKKIYSSIYDINKIDNISNELNSLTLEFDKLMRNISDLLDRLL